MRCWKIRARLVAYQDGELSPGEAHQVREHLAACARCRHLERRLEEVTPRPELRVPAHVQARLEARVTGPALRARSASLPPDRPRAASLRLIDWLRRDAGFSMGAVLVCTVVAMLLGWSLGHLSHTALPRLARGTDPAITVLEADGTVERLPADQYRPASYTPADDATYR